jgi:hypothetical protein
MKHTKRLLQTFFAVTLLFSLKTAHSADVSLDGIWVLECPSSGGPHYFVTFEFKKENQLNCTITAFGSNISGKDRYDYKGCILNKEQYLIKYTLVKDVQYQDNTRALVVTQKGGNFLTLNSKDEIPNALLNNLCNRAWLVNNQNNVLRLRDVSATGEVCELTPFVSEIHSIKSTIMKADKQLNRDLLQLNILKKLIGEWRLTNKDALPFKTERLWGFDENGFVFAADFGFYSVKDKTILFSSGVVSYDSETCEELPYELKDNTLEIRYDDNITLKFEKLR